MATDYRRNLYKDYELLLTKKEETEDKYRLMCYKYHLLQQAQKRQNEREKQLNRQLQRQNEELEALKREVARLTCNWNTDGTNSGLPTSQTPLHKKKVIPNSRKKSEKKIGAQAGHPKAILKAFADDEVTEIEEHKAQACPHCGGEAMETEERICKDELDYDVVVIKRRHQFVICKCEICGKEFHEPIPVRLKEENQYGSRVRALGLALMNVGNVSVNKVRKMIYGLSEEAIHPTEGYLMKQQKKAAMQLEGFQEELRQKCLRLQTVYWDDTVIDINTRRSCLRFYGDERHALYRAHLRKGKEGLDQDQILQLLSEQTHVMHDHNRVNYNKEYSYSNIECNVHLLRDLQKTTDHLQHQWSIQLKQLLEQTNQQRNEAIQRGETAFDDAYVKTFFEQFDDVMCLAAEENQNDFSRYYGRDEQTLILRILSYKDNYLAWVVNFSLPFSNNLSERALRGVKSKMKVAGQFQKEETARDYAAVKSYIETCYRNGVNETEALIRLCEGHPFTVAELFLQESDA